MTLEMNWMPFLNKDDGTLATDIKTLSEKTRSFYLLQLCKNKAFDERKATNILCLTPSTRTRAVQFNRNFEDKLANALRVAKTLVFQESIKQRLEKAKLYELQQDLNANK